jgi:hypothetical protein
MGHSIYYIPKLECDNATPNELTLKLDEVTSDGLSRQPDT